jgi:hypothetical protein
MMNNVKVTSGNPEERNTQVEISYKENGIT